MWLVVLVLLAALGVGIPIALSMGLAGLAGMSGIPLSVMAQQLVGGLKSFPLVTIPLFLFLGNLMTETGLIEGLVRLSNALLGRFRGGLGLATIAAGMFFAGISGSAVADTASLGAVMIPTMKKEGYGGGFAGAITAAAGALGPIIPPSVLMVIYGVQTGQSIGRLFLAGAVPGIAMGLVLMGTCWLIAQRRGYPVHGRAGLTEIGRAFVQSVPALVIPLIVVVGVVAGVFTVTESAAIVVVYAVATSLLSRRVGIGDLARVMRTTVSETAAVAFVIGASAFLAWVITRGQLPQAVLVAMKEYALNKFAVLLMMNLLLFLLGMLLAPAAALVVATPLLLPLAQSYGIDPVQFGVMTVFNLNLGLLTPPVAIGLYMTARLAQTSFQEQVREALPFLLGCLVVLALITYWPPMTLALAAYLGKS